MAFWIGRRSIISIKNFVFFNYLPSHFYSDLPEKNAVFLKHFWHVLVMMFKIILVFQMFKLQLFQLNFNRISSPKYINMPRFNYWCGCSVYRDIEKKWGQRMLWPYSTILHVAENSWLPPKTDRILINWFGQNNALFLLIIYVS